MYLEWNGPFIYWSLCICELEDDTEIVLLESKAHYANIYPCCFPFVSSILYKYVNYNNIKLNKLIFAKCNLLFNTKDQATLFV